MIERAATLTRSEITRLDIEERRHTALLAAWDILRSQTETDPLKARRLAARNAAWAAVNRSLVRLDLEPLVDDGYWRVTTRLGFGAARAARFAACAFACGEETDPDVAEVLTRPWLAVSRRP